MRIHILLTISLLFILAVSITGTSFGKEIVEPKPIDKYEDIKVLPINEQFNKTVSVGIGFATDKDVSIYQVNETIKITSASKKPSVIFIPGNLHYRYTVQHVNDSGNITNEFVVYPQLIGDDWYVVFDADQWSYYTVDGSLINVGITDMRLNNQTVEITGDGYNRLVLQADYGSNKLFGWNQLYIQSYQKLHNPWPVNTKVWTPEQFFVGKSIDNSGNSIFHTGDYHLNIDIYFGAYYRNSWTHSKANNYYQLQFYVDNDGGTPIDAVIEAYTPDNIDYTIIEAWNQTSGAYEEFWNGSTSTFTNASLLNLNSSTTGMNFTIYESSQRGDTVSPIGGNMSKPDQTVSAYYGCVNRTLELYTLPMDDGADSATTGASQIKIRRKVVYIHPGYATYEFKNDNDLYYGLKNLELDATGSVSTLMLAKAGTQNVTYITNESGNAVTGMTVRANEDELIDRLYITYANESTNISAIINQSAIDIDTDSDGDDVPDAFEDENITVNKGQQGGELKWDYVWEGAFNIVNSTGYIYYINLINGSELVGTEIQTAGTQNMSMNTAGAGETYNFTVNSGTVDWLNVTSGLDTNSIYLLRYSNDTFIEGQSTDVNQYANFTVDLPAGTYYISKSSIGVWRFNSTAGAYSNTTTDTIQPCQGILAYVPNNFIWVRSDL